jgi:hypothetical protein
MIVTVGLIDLAAYIAGKYIYMGIGTGTTAPTLGDTTLETESVGYREECETHTSTGAVATFETEFTIVTSPLVVTEAALFDAGVDGNMFARQVFGALNLAVSDKLKITWTITFANA